MHAAISKPIKEDWLKKRWYEIVGSGQITHREHGAHVGVIRDPGRMGTYFAKYMGKKDSKAVPDNFEQCGRFWGLSRDFINLVQYNFKFNTPGAIRFVRYYKKWYFAHLRDCMKIKWKIPSSGFTAWDGRKFIEAYRSRFQPQVFMA